MPIALDLDASLFVLKTQSVPLATEFMSNIRPVSLDELLVDGGCLLHVFKESLGVHGNLPNTMLNLAFVEDEKVLVEKANELIDVFVFGEGLSSAVHLRAVVLAAWVAHEQRGRKGRRLRRKVKKPVVRRAPYGVKLSLDKHAGPFSDGPSINDSPAVPRNVVLNDKEALQVRLAMKRRAGNIARRGFVITDHAARKARDVWFDEFGRSHDR